MRGDRRHGADQQVGRERRRRIVVAGRKPGRAFDPFRSVGTEQRRAQRELLPLPVGQHGDRAVATPAQCPEQGAFGHDFGSACGVIDARQQRDCLGIVRPAFDRDRALARRGEPFVGGERMADSDFTQAVEPGGGEQRRVRLAGGELGQPGRDVSAERDYLAVRAGMEHLRGAARGAGPDPRALGKRGDRCGPDQNVADILAGQDGGDDDLARAGRFDVLGRVDRDVDLAGKQPGIEFLGPQRLAADLRERPVLDPVAAGGDGDEFDVRFAQAVGGGKARLGLLGLGHGEGRTAGAETERPGTIGHGGLCYPPNCFRGSQDEGLSMKVVLGIESSCDETAAALVTDGRAILAQRIASQDDEHRPYGGVVPEIAARTHAERLAPLIEGTLNDAGMTLHDLDAIAATAGPGLIGGVMVGLVTAKALAMASDKPLIAINHLEGHALSPRLADPTLEFPYLLLLVSGGHCQILRIDGLGQYRRLATTIDDALGEAFDKTAKILGLGFPGGPAVERLARAGDAGAVRLPRPLVGSGEPHFSFAGLKSAVLRVKQAQDGACPSTGSGRADDSSNARRAGRAEPVEAYSDADIAASSPGAALDCVIDRTRIALGKAGEVSALVVAGGVAANQAMRSALEALAGEHALRFVAPPRALCTDNAAMIAWAGVERLALGQDDPLDIAARPRWPLDPAAETVRGAGVKA
jgi:N6-L-threonylcarbamoyladenine synthase